MFSLYFSLYFAVKQKKTTTKVPWTQAERDAVDRHFIHHIKRGKAVQKSEAVKCLANEPVLSKRSWEAIKWHVKNRSTSWSRQAIDLFRPK